MSLQSKIIKPPRKLNNEEVQVTTQIYKSKGTISIKELTDLVKVIQNKGNAKYKKFSVPLIRVLNGDRWAGFSTKEEFDSYYEGNVKDVSKFENISHLQITTIYSN